MLADTGPSCTRTPVRRPIFPAVLSRRLRPPHRARRGGIRSGSRLGRGHGHDWRPVRACEVPDVRLLRMTDDRSERNPRRRPTETAREAARLTNAIAASLGRDVRTSRRESRLSQAQIAQRVGVHQSWISRIESGRGGSAGLDVWIAIGAALGRPLAVTLSRPLAQERRPLDAGHLEIQEHLLSLARRTRRSASFELPTRPADPRHSIDVCVRDVAARILFIEEAWNTFTDLGAAIRSTRRKEAEAADLAIAIGHGDPFRVATVWVVRDTMANRALMARYPQIVRSAFPGASRSWVQALCSRTAPPVAPGLVWFDAATRRIHEWRPSTRQA